MTIFLKVFGSGNDQGATTQDAVYVTARAATGGTDSTIQQTAQIGQDVTTNYLLSQFNAVFNTSTVPAGAGTGQLALNCTVAVTTASGDTLEIRETPTWTGHIPGANLAALALYGTLAIPTTTGLKTSSTFPDITGLSRISSLKLLVHSQNERANVAPTTNNRPTFNTADVTGTVNDPALTLVAGNPWRFIAAGTSVEATATPHVLTEPAGAAAGDLLVACIGSRIASTTAITLPSGWTRVNQALNNNILTTSSALPSGMMAYILRGSSAPSYTFTHPTAPSVALGRVFAYRNVHQTTPLDTGTTAVTTGTALLSVSVTGLTTTADDDLIVAMCVGGQEAAWSAFAATDPATGSGTTADSTLDPIWGQWLERSDIQTTTGSDTSLAVYDAVKQTAGATGNLIATASVSAGHVVVAGSFKLAPSGPPPSTGTLAATFDAVTLAGSGAVTTPERFATLSATLGEATLAATANVIIQGYLRGPGTAARVSEAGSNRVTEAGSTRRLEGYGLADLALTATGTAGFAANGATLAVTLDPATLAATGTVANQVFSGTLNTTLGALTGTLTGKVTVGGTAAGTLLPMTVVATGTVANQVFSGTLAQTLASLALAGTGTVANQVFSGTLSATLGALTGTLTGKVTVQGTAAGTLLPMTVVATGTVANQVFTGTLAATLASLTLAGTGQVAVKGTLGVTLDALQLISSSQPVAVGSLAATFGPVALASAGSLGPVPLSATLSVTLASLSQTLTGKVTVGGTAAGTLLPVVLVGTGTVAASISTGTLSATLGSLALSATGTVASHVSNGTANITLGNLTLSASGLIVTGSRIGTLDAMLDELGLQTHGKVYLPWTTEARRYQLWARETPPTAVGIAHRLAENKNRRITEAYDGRIIDGLSWAIEPRASGNWAAERLGFTGVSNRRLTQSDDRRVTEASDIRVLEDSSLWIKRAPSPVNIWTKE